MPTQAEFLELSVIVQQVRHWPAARRFELIQQILASLAPEMVEPKSTLSQALGLLSTEKTLSDNDVERLLEERRRERYGL